MRCTECGHEINEYSNSCENCGAITTNPEPVSRLRQTKPTKKKKKRYKFNKKRVFIALFCLLIICAGAVAAYFMMEKEEPEKIGLRVVNEKANEYLLLNVSEYFKFDVQGDSDNKPEFEIKKIGMASDIGVGESDDGGDVTVSAPEDGYEPGQTYTITLGEKTSFKDSQYEKAKILHFQVNRRPIVKTEYKESIKVLKKDQVTLNKNSLETEELCNTGDVFLVESESGNVPCKILGTIGIRGKTIARYEPPKIDELYQTIDINTTIVSDSNYLTVDKGVVLEATKQSGIISALIDDVSALSSDDIKAAVKQSGNDLIRVTIDIQDPKYKKRVVTLTFSLRYKVELDIKNQRQFMDCELDLTDNIDISVKGQETEELQSEIKATIADFNKSTDPLEKKDKSLDGDEFFHIFKVKVPIQDSIYFYSDFGTDYGLRSGGKVAMELDSKLSLNNGALIDKGQIMLQYANAKTQLQGPIALKGETESKAGLSGEMGVQLVGDSKISFHLKPEVFTNMRGYFVSQDISNFSKEKGYYDIQAGTRIQDTLQVTLRYTGGKARHKEQLLDEVIPTVNKNNVTAVKKVNIKSKYAFKKGKLDIGQLKATYEDVLDHKTNSESIKAYNFYVDGKRVRMTNGIAQSPVEEGEHTFRIKWRYKDRKYSFAKKVMVVDSFDFSVITAITYQDHIKSGRKTTDIDIAIPKVKSSTESAQECNAKISQYCGVGIDMANALMYDTALPADYGNIKTFTSYRWYYEVFHYEDTTALVISSMVRGRGWGGWDAHYALYYDNSTGELISPAAYAEAAGYSADQVMELAQKGKGKDDKVFVPADIDAFGNQGTTFYVNNEGTLNVRYGVTH